MNNAEAWASPLRESTFDLSRGSIGFQPLRTGGTPMLPENSSLMT